jgi:hypothetical protein
LKKDQMMTERRETTVNVERPPPTQTVHKETVRESNSTGVLVGIILAILVIGVIAFMLWPGSAPDTGTDTDVTIETPAAPPPAPAPDVTTPEPAPPPAATAPEPAAPPADTVPELPPPPTTTPEPAPEPVPAPAPAQ